MGDLIKKCSCGSGQHEAECCQILLDGKASASSPEALMRSRYVAYMQGNVEYLLQTWHPSTCPQRLQLDSQLVWTNLKIISAPIAKTHQGEVEFVASYRLGEEQGGMRECSQFVHEQGQWFYISGEQKALDKNLKQNRNDPCACGSGKKFKKCCGAKH